MMVYGLNIWWFTANFG